jgi:hypothetical protein
MQMIELENTTMKQNQVNSKKGLQILLETDEDDTRPVYIAGNFNNWKTQDKNYMMEQIGANLYQFNFAIDFTFPDELLYKFTKGD